ncbi:hypothetical protein [Erythrobacter sp. Alg231-14]|uniref:hypothetical protein n=1 Tax=Erythrobacter sp. Alg231-14 TaxID=1922225 RepID=UPI00307B8D99
MPPRSFPRSQHAMLPALDHLPRLGLATLCLALSHAAIAAPAAAQAPDRIDLLAAQEPFEPDEFAVEQCERDADAAKIAGEILVCRDLTENTDGYWDKEAWEKRYGAETQGRQPPDVDGTGLPNGMVPLVTIRACFIPPCPTEPAIMIDFDELPDAPGGSDADRIAHGLPPLGDDGDLGRGPISEEELVLPPAPMF